MGATPLFKDTDGNDTEINRVQGISITQVSNGWIITTGYEDEDEITEVFNSNLDAVNAIIESMGLNQELTVKSKKA